MIIMNGLELCKKYFEEIGRPAFEKECPEILGRAAFGLVGEGSECFGFDDEISRDHDWGPGFCLWLSSDDYEKFGARATEVYNSLPKEFMGYERLRQSEMTSGRVGVMTVEDFYCRFTGLNRAPQTLSEWRFLPDSNFAVVTNGQVWEDGLGLFTEIRKKILAHYPEDVRKKKISHHAAVAAQSGQYNFYRCEKRGDKVSTLQSKSIFIEHTQALVFLLNLRFRPYYKWTNSLMKQLPILGAEISDLTEKLAESSAESGRIIEEISALIINEFKTQGLSSSSSDFLMDHAYEIKESINDLSMRNSHIMEL